MTRVVQVVWGFEPFGGMEQHVVQLAAGLSRAGVDVTIVSEMPVDRSNSYACELHKLGISLFDAPRWVWIANAAHIALHRSRYDIRRLIHGEGLLSGRLVRTIERLHAETPIDLIHIHGCRLNQAWLSEWARSRGIPTMYTEHVAITESGGTLAPDGIRQALAANVLACVSEHSRRSLESLLGTVHPIAVTGHIMSTPAGPFGPSDNMDSREIEIICTSRLAAYKGIDILLHAFAMAIEREPKLRLTLAGSGHLAAELKMLARELGIHRSVRFLGAVPPNEIFAALRHADIAVLPSRSEGLPLALLEAMSCARPIIATRAGGMPEVIDNGENGLLVSIEDADALADALILLAGDAGLRDRLGAAALRSFEASHHHESHVIPEMLALYRQAASA